MSDYKPDQDEFRDYNDELGSTDYSQMSDHSAGITSKTNNNSLAENGNLSKAWNSGINSDLNGKSSLIKSSAKKSAPNKSGFYNKTGLGKSSIIGGGSLSDKVKMRILAWVLTGLFGGGGIVVMLLSGPKILSAKILDVIEKRFVAPTSKAVSSHTKKLWKCKLSASCSKDINEKTNASGEKGDGMGQISDAAEESIKNNGGDVSTPKDGADGNIKLKNGEKVGTTGKDGVQDIEKMSPATESEFRNSSPAADGASGALGGDPTADMLKTTGSNKNIPIDEKVGDKNGKSQTIGEQLETQKNATDDPNSPNKAPPEDLTVQLAKTVQPDVSPEFAKKPNSGGNADEDVPKSGFTEASGGMNDLESGGSILKRAKSKLDEIPASLKKAGTAAIAFGGFACGMTGANKAVLIGVKLQKILALVKFSSTFLSVLNSVQATDGTSEKGHTGPTTEQFSQLMDSLTTVLRDKNGKVLTKSGTDSFGYQLAAGYLSPSGNKFDISNTSKSSGSGQPSEFTSSAVVDGKIGQSNKWFDALQGLNIPGSETLTAILKGACPYLMGAMNFLQVGGLVSDGAVLFKAFNPAGWISLGAKGFAIALQFLSGSDEAATAAATLDVIGSCIGVVASGTISECVVSVLSAVVTIATPKIVGTLIDKFKDEYLTNPMPVGADAMDAIMSGAGASMGMNAAGNGVPVMPSTSTTAGLTNYLAVNRELATYNKQEDAVKRANASPFDVYNQATFAGSIMGNFMASLYANGNKPTEMIGSLFGMFGTGFANILNGTSAMADAASTAYASSCSDSDFNTLEKGGNGLAADPFCNPIYGLSEENTMDEEETIDAISKWKDVDGNGAIDSKASGYNDVYGLNFNALIPGKGLGKEKIGYFIDECITRNGSDKQFMPMGSKNDDSTIDTGSNCAFGNSKKYGGDQNLKILYNYIQYYLANTNINQGSNLGCKADGSCGSTSPNSADTGSIADVAKTMAGWGDAQNENLYNFGGGHGDTDDLKSRIAAKFQPNAMSVDCSGFVRAAIYQATGKDVGSIFANGSAAEGMLDGDISSHLTKIDPSQAQPGDLFSRNNDTVGGGHTGVILSNDTSAKKFQTAESYGGHGPGLNTRTYDEATIYRYKP